jgi:hypothetical protein
MSDTELIREIYGCSQDELIMQLEAEMLIPSPHKEIEGKHYVPKPREKTKRIGIDEEQVEVLVRLATTSKKNKDTYRKIFRAILERPGRTVPLLAKKTDCTLLMAEKCIFVYNNYVGYVPIGQYVRINDRTN